MRLFGTAFALLAASALSPAGAARPVRFSAEAARDGAVVLPLGGGNDLAVRGAGLDAAAREAVARALASADFDYGRRSLLSLRGIGPWSQILVVGIGAGPLDAAALQDVGGIAARETANVDGPVTLVARGLAPSIGDAAVQLGIGARLGGYAFDRYKWVDPAKPRPAGRTAPLTVLTPQAAAAAAAYGRSGEPLAEAVAFARDLVSEPGNIVYPEIFVDRTREAFNGVAGVGIEVLDVPAMERLGLGAILSVGKGSVRPPRLMIVEYKGPGAEGAPIVLAGKGITFDSGGLSLKERTGMWLMKFDMSGAAAVVATALALARQQAPVNIVAIAALAENMPSGSAARPGDVVRAYNGKTIEILNTDAEGRLVLADAVSYAERRYRPAAIVDMATLTGAVGQALGEEYAGLFTRHDALADQLRNAGKATGEELWRLPLHPRYAENMKSDIADIKNVVEGGTPGASYGGHLIGYFVDPATPWAHLDIGDKGWERNGRPTVPKGAAGFGVRLLERFVRDFRPIPASMPGAAQ